MNDVYSGDALEVLRGLEDHSVDAVVTDPPAGISFMGKGWDSDKGGRDAWVAWLSEIMRECRRVLKPGGHAFVWALPRTSHWTATAVEDAGFEVRDVVMHLFGTGFPKSMSIDKAIDRELGAEREVVGVNPHYSAGRKEFGVMQSVGAHRNNDRPCFNRDGAQGKASSITAPATPEAERWDGWGTALKPAAEHWILARAPLSERTIAANVLKHGTGGLNIDDCRVGTEQTVTRRTGNSGAHGRYGKDDRMFERINPPGRFPANVILDEDAAEMLDEQSGVTKSGAMKRTVSSYEGESVAGFLRGKSGPHNQHGDSGGASRFFYVAKASRNERTHGGKVENKHPTVKPIKLMEYLITMITPPGGVVLDPFCGSGSTLVAAKRLGFGYIGIDREYAELAKERLRFTDTEGEKRASLL